MFCPIRRKPLGPGIHAGTPSGGARRDGVGKVNRGSTLACPVRGGVEHAKPLTEQRGLLCWVSNIGPISKAGVCGCSRRLLCC